MLAHELGHHSRDHLWKLIGWFALVALPMAWLIALATRRRGGMYEPRAVPLALLVAVVLQIAITPAPERRSRAATRPRPTGSRSRPRAIPRAAREAVRGAGARRASPTREPPAWAIRPVRHPSDDHAAASRWSRPGRRASGRPTPIRLRPLTRANRPREVTWKPPRRHHAPTQPAAVAPRADYPVAFDVEYPERLSRWKIFVKWLFAIPHFIIVYLLRHRERRDGLHRLLRDPVHEEVAARHVRLLGPDPALDRSTSYAYALLLLRDEYPPFSGERGRVSRSRSRSSTTRTSRAGMIFVKWLLAIPHLFVLAVPGDRGLRRGRHRLLRDPVHGPLSARACSTSWSAPCAGRCA